uniref:Uncharacterized protein n=1 Tax=Romanomermis culicivorax TaxID=13658 RepID=A0A915J357_ROMCU
MFPDPKQDPKLPDLFLDGSGPESDFFEISDPDPDLNPNLIFLKCWTWTRTGPGPDIFRICYPICLCEYKRVGLGLFGAAISEPAITAPVISTPNSELAGVEMASAKRTDAELAGAEMAQRRTDWRQNGDAEVS